MSRLAIIIALALAACGQEPGPATAGELRCEGAAPVRITRTPPREAGEQWFTEQGAPVTVLPGCRIEPTI